MGKLPDRSRSAVPDLEECHFTVAAPRSCPTAPLPSRTRSGGQQLTQVDPHDNCGAARDGPPLRSAISESLNFHSHLI